MTAELVDTESDTTADEQLVTQYRMSTYIEQFTDPDVSSCEDLGDKPVFLTRCLSHSLSIPSTHTTPWPHFIIDVGLVQRGYSIPSPVLLKCCVASVVA